MGNIYTIAGDGTGGYNGDGMPATSAELSYPALISVDAHGNPVIADFDNSRLRVVAVSALDPGYPLGGCSGTCTWTVGDIYTIAGNGGQGYNGDGISAPSAEVYGPNGLGLDGEGNVLAAESGGNRVRVVAVSASNPGYPLAGCSGTCTWTLGDIYTIAGNGVQGYNSDGIAAQRGARLPQWCGCRHQREPAYHGHK